MPRGDGTDPTNIGPMTDRVAGYSAVFRAFGFAKPAPGMSFRESCSYYTRI